MKKIEKYYISSYRIDGIGDLDNDFVVPRHGNATKPIATGYYRTDAKIIKEATSKLNKKMSADAVYKSLSSAQGSSSVSEELRNPRQVHNIKSSLKSNDSKKSEIKNGRDEIQDIVEQMLDINSSEKFTRSVTILPSHFYSIHLSTKA